MKGTRHPKKAERGASIMEFGLAFLLFFVVLCAVMEFGRIVASYNILAGATKEGARYAMVHGSASGAAATQSDVQNVVRSWAVGLERQSVVVTTTWSPGNAPGNRVRVEATYAMLPFTAIAVKSGLTLRSTAQMTISQ